MAGRLEACLKSFEWGHSFSDHQGYRKKKQTLDNQTRYNAELEAEELQKIGDQQGHEHVDEVLEPRKQIRNFDGFTAELFECGIQHTRDKKGFHDGDGKLRQ